MAGVNMTGIVLNVQTKKEEFVKGTTTTVQAFSDEGNQVGDILGLDFNGTEYWAAYTHEITELWIYEFWGYALTAAGAGQVIQVRLLP